MCVMRCAEITWCLRLVLCPGLAGAVAAHDVLHRLCNMKLLYANHELCLLNQIPFKVCIV